jgi:two-component system CheB/CheR fusion protein
MNKRKKRVSKKEKSTIEPSEFPKSEFHYVAIGASAGGLEAIETFFTHMSPESGLAFIVIQHLSPDYKSLMVELLSKKTEMKVQRAEEGMVVEPNNIYLIPPKKNLTIFHGKLLLNEQDHSKGINLPIDIFLMSLSEDQGDMAVGVILSGTGSDGMRGVRSIKENGGMVMVQNEESAKFDGMPRAALSTGLADFTLPPEDMPKQLLNYARHPYVSRMDRAEQPIKDEDDTTKIFSILRERCKVDFTFYKPSTINRRIERRMTVNNIDEIGNYVNYLQNYPGEVTALFRELLIGVTSFFRDFQAFELLAREYMPAIFEGSENREIRFWVPGCSTGEEAYSLAILAKETMDSMGVKHDVKVFATDVDRDAIHFAAVGKYPESIVADISTSYLTKYFHKREESFQISRNIREMVVFAQHNLLKDPPFTNIDLISCRNLLIYLQPVLQRRVLDFFNFSLNPGSILFLGLSETTGEMADYYEVKDAKHKIYASKGRGKRLNEKTPYATATDTRFRVIRDTSAGIRRAIHTADEERILERFIETVSGDLFPLTFVVNEQMEVLHIMGETEGFVKLSSGKVSHDITRMISKDIAIPVSTGIQKVIRNNKEVRFSNITTKISGEMKNIDLRIIPLAARKGQYPLIAVMINEKLKEKLAESDDQTAVSYDMTKETEQRIQDLEQELQFSRENLQATIEELETANEELQATNEELLASNEELQSTNEELQSTNEELQTVNAEYHKKIIELTELHNDVDNLLSISQIGKLILDENLEIRKFSENITEIFKILESDVGRPVTHLMHHIDGVDPVEYVRRVEATARPVKLEVMTTNGRWYLMRIEPYRVGPDIFSGTLLSFLEISEYKKMEIDRKSTEDRYQFLFNTMALGVVYQDSEGNITAANPAAERILGLTMDQMMGRHSVDPEWKSIHMDGSDFPGEEHPTMVALRTGKEVNNVIMGVYNPLVESYKWIKINAIPQFREGENKPYIVYATFEDITEQLNWEIELQDSEKQYKMLFENLDCGVALHEIICDESGKPVDYKYIDVNNAFERITGLTREKVKGKRVLEVLPETEDFFIDHYGEVALTGKPDKFERYNKELKKWFSVKAFSPGEMQFAVIFHEIDPPDEKKN